MKIKQITMKGVTKHTETVVDLPDRGIVLVTGSNGSGKSSVVEAVPLCMWGKTLRRADLWDARSTDAQHVSVTADGVAYTRKAKGRVRLTWDGAPKHESTKEAQRDFNTAQMTFEHWRRACVLSSADAANFTTATDSERKRLLESLTGVEKLEAGYRKALDEAREARASAGDLSGTVAILRERVAGIRRRIADAVPPDDVPAPVEVEVDALPGLREQAEDAQADIRQANEAAAEVGQQMAVAVSEAATAERQRRNIDHDQCHD